MFICIIILLRFRVMQMFVQVCNHPDLITGAGSGTIMFPPASELIEHSGKLALLDRLLRELHKRGHRVLIFSQVSTYRLN